MGAGFFDAHILEMGVEIRRAGGREELGELEGVGGENNQNNPGQRAIFPNIRNNCSLSLFFCMAWNLKIT